MSTPDWWSIAEPEVHDAVKDFAEWLRQKVANIKPYQLIEKNPFLFRARAPRNSEELADKLIDAFLSSSEETRFGDILEEISIAICSPAKGGKKSGIEGIDLEYDEAETRTVVQIKSSKKWGNSSQRKRLVSNFQSVTIRLHQGGINARCVEGICYGPSEFQHLGSHLRLVGNVYWFDISGWQATGKAVLDAIEYHASNGITEARNIGRAGVIDYLRRTGCESPNGGLDWDRIYDLIMMPTRERPH